MADNIDLDLQICILSPCSSDEKLREGEGGVGGGGDVICTLSAPCVNVTHGRPYLTTQIGI